MKYLLKKHKNKRLNILLEFFCFEICVYLFIYDDSTEQQQKIKGIVPC